MNIFKLSKMILGLAACMTLAACGQNGGGASGSVTGQSLQQQQLNQLNNLPTLAGEIDLHFDLVRDVDVFAIPFVLPAAFIDNSTALPRFPKIALVSGVGDLGLLTGANGSSIITPIPYLNASAVFSDDTTEGQNCVQAANDAFNHNLQMEIKGQGYIVQIAPWCPPGSTCIAEPQTPPQMPVGAPGNSAEAEADSVASMAPTLVTTPPLPAPWTVPQFTVLYRTIDFCVAADPIAPIPVNVAAPL